MCLLIAHPPHVYSYHHPRDMFFDTGEGEAGGDQAGRALQPLAAGTAPATLAAKEVEVEVEGAGQAMPPTRRVACVPLSYLTGNHLVRLVSALLVRPLTVDQVRGGGVQRCRGWKGSGHATVLLQTPPPAAPCM